MMQRFKYAVLIMLICNALPINVCAVNAVSDTLEQNSITLSDKIPVGRSNVEYSVNAQLPVTTNKELADNFNAWLAKQFSSVIDKADSMKQNKSCDILRGQFESQFINQSVQEIKELNKTNGKGKDNSVSPKNYVLYVTIKREYETNDIITYSFVSEAYTGGAHGTHRAEYATFNKSKGKILTLADLVPARKSKDFSKLVTNGIMRFFGITDFNSLKGRLLNDKEYYESKFPMPESYPGVTKDGLRLQYQYYEIAPYSDGAPFAVIPFSNLSKIVPNKYLQTFNK